MREAAMPVVFHLGCSLVAINDRYDHHVAPYMGSDGQVRVAELRLEDGQWKVTDDD